MKLNEIDILYKHTKSNSSKDFLSWLKRKRPNTILKNKHQGPWYKNKLSISSKMDSEAGIYVCKRILEYVQKVPNNLTPIDFKILLGIIRRIRHEINLFENDLNNYRLYDVEAEFLYWTNESNAAKFVLSTLEELNVPFNGSTQRLYELLIELDQYYLGENRLRQRQILAHSFRKKDTPPFFAEDNIALITGGIKTPFTNITPALIQEIDSNKTLWASDLSKQIDFNWDYAVLAESLDVFSSNGVFIDTLPSGQASKIWAYPVYWTTANLVICCS